VFTVLPNKVLFGPAAIFWLLLPEEDDTGQFCGEDDDEDKNWATIALRLWTLSAGEK